jgi:hypothetical protein
MGWGTKQVRFVFVELGPTSFDGSFRVTEQDREGSLGIGKNRVLGCSSENRSLRCGATLAFGV